MYVLFAILRFSLFKNNTTDVLYLNNFLLISTAETGQKKSLL